MESGLHHQWRAVQADSNVLQTHQLTRHLPIHDEHAILHPNSQWWTDGIHGQHGDAYEAKRRGDRRRTPRTALNINKCKFELPHINFLGVRVKNNQLKMEDAKIEKVRDWVLPRNLKEVWRFLGFTGYYQYFIKGYSAIAWPLLDLTKQAAPWHWGESQQQAFKMLKA